MKQKYCNQFHSWCWNSNMTAVGAPKIWISPYVRHHQNRITGTQQHHKLILHLSCHVQRVFVVSTKEEQGTIRVVKKQLLVITNALIKREVTERAISCHRRWYLWLQHFIIRLSIHLICHRFFNIHSALNRTLLITTGTFIARTVTKITIIFHHRWNLCLLHWMIQSIIQLICSWFVNIHPALHRTQCQSSKLLQYQVGFYLIHKIPCYLCTPIMEVTICMDAWLMCISWQRNNNNRMT